MVASDAADARDLARRPRLSPPVKLGLRIAVSAALLAFLITKIPADSITPRNDHAGTLAFLAAGLLMTLVGVVLSAWRWQRVLAVFDTHVSLRTLLSHYLAGQFVGNVLPSTVGGDVLRISRSSQDTGSREVAFAAVVLERLTGFVALPLITFFGFAIRPELIDEPRAWLALVLAGATVGFLAILLILA